MPSCSFGQQQQHRKAGSAPARFLLVCFVLAVGYQVLLVVGTFGSVQTITPATLTRIKTTVYPLDHDDNPTPSFPRCNAFIPQLTEELRNDPIRNGLRPIRLHLPTSVSTPNNETALSSPSFVVKGMTPDLFPSVFRGHRIALLGDSTLYYLTKWIYSMFHHSNTRKPFLPSKNVTYNLTQASQSVVDYATHMCDSSADDEPCVQPYDHMRPVPVMDTVQNLYYMQWGGMSGIGDNWQTEQFLQIMWEETVAMIRPDVMVVNMGLHWLHLYGVARDTGPQAIVRWLQYETWLQEVLDHAIDLGVKVLLYKTTNYVCDSKLTNMYAKGVTLYSASDPTTLTKCADKVRAAFVKEPAGINITEPQIADYCANGTLSFHGSSLLNQKLYAFLNHMGDSSPPGMYVGLFNDHDIQTCEHTAEGDGLHYHSLNLLRIRLLANYLQCATSEIVRSSSERIGSS